MTNYDWSIFKLIESPTPISNFFHPVEWSTEALCGSPTVWGVIIALYSTQGKTVRGHFPSKYPVKIKDGAYQTSRSTYQFAENTRERKLKPHHDKAKKQSPKQG